MNEARQKIIGLIAEAEKAVPLELKPDLPPGPYTSGTPEWYDFEHTIWALGENIRQGFLDNKSLRKDIELQQAILRIAIDPKAKRGRQSFIMLLGYTSCSQFAHQIVSQLSDPHVCGHVIDTLLKMKASGFVNEVGPFAKDKTAWIRNKAKRYLEKYCIS